MKLIYDIAVMAQLVAACQSANAEIVKAEQLVQQVRSHGDWTCKEKSVIDELMQECKSLVQRMREDQSSFLRILKEVEGELNDTENSVSNLFSGVESILGKVLAIPVAQTVAVGGGLIGVGAIGSKIGDVIKNGFENISDVINPGTVGTGWAGDLLDKMKDIGEEILDTDVIWHGPGTIWGNTGILNGISSHIFDTVEDNPIAPPPPSRIEGMADLISNGFQNSVENFVDGARDILLDTTRTPQPVVEDIGTMFQDIANDIRNDTDRLSDLWGRTTCPPIDTVPDLSGLAEKVIEHSRIKETPIPIIKPVVTPVVDVLSDVWVQVQDSAFGDAVQDALRGLTENIAVCSMGDLSL